MSCGLAAGCLWRVHSPSSAWRGRSTELGTPQRVLVTRATVNHEGKMCEAGAWWRADVSEVRSRDGGVTHAASFPSHPSKATTRRFPSVTAPPLRGRVFSPGPHALCANGAESLERLTVSNRLPPYQGR